MKVLLVGDTSSYFIDKIRTNLERTKKYQIYTFNINPKNADKGSIKKSKVSWKKIITSRLARILSKIKILYIKNFLYQLFLKKEYVKFRQQIEKYDIVNFHLIDDNSLNYVKYYQENIHLPNQKLILSFWGSDFYKRDKSKDLSLNEILLKTDVITFTNEKTLQSFKNEFNSIAIKKIKLIPFGLEQLDFIETDVETKVKSKTTLNIPLGKIAVTIGYNASKNQQHEKIVAELDQLTKDSKLVRDLHLIVPLTYGADEMYKRMISEMYAKLPFSNTIYTRYLLDDEITHLRQASDLMIQLQETDQFSGSMQEYLFARNVVLTGNWLPYERLIDSKVYFHRLNSVHDLHKHIVKIIENYEMEYTLTVDNPEKIYNISSWSNTIDLWDELYTP